MNEVSNAIREARLDAGLTQGEVADSIKPKTCGSTVSQWESDRYKGHSVRTLNRLADLFGCDLVIKFVRKPSKTR